MKKIAENAIYTFVGGISGCMGFLPAFNCIGNCSGCPGCISAGTLLIILALIHKCRKRNSPDHDYKKDDV